MTGICVWIFSGKKGKDGDRITALQQLLYPFGGGII